MLAADEILLLLNRIAEHSDETALKQLFDEFYPRLLVFTDSFVKNRPVAEELVEDVFIKLWENKNLLPGITSLPAYLFRVAKNNLLNYQKSNKNQSHLDIDAVAISLQATVKNPEELFIAAEAIHRVNAAIALLPPKCRLVFRLLKEDGLKYREVAELLQLSVKTVENQMSFALKKIGEAIIVQKPDAGFPSQQKK